MIDISFVGKDGLIIDYDDIVCMLGFNVIRYLRYKQANDIAMRMSLEDILLSYINREKEDPSIWLKSKFNVDFDINQFINSVNAFQPNWLYSYKIFNEAYKNGVKELMIHTNIDIPLVKQILSTYTVQVKYVCGDIVPILNDHKNITYITASSTNLKRCLETDVPCAITIVDDFLHTADVVIDKIDDKLKEVNKYVCYTSITNGGLINLDKRS